MAWLIESYEALNEGIADKIQDSFEKLCKIKLVKATSKSVLDMLYNKEAYCWEGGYVPGKYKDDDLERLGMQILRRYNFPARKMTLYYTDGKTINDIYHLTGDNAYKKDYGFLFVDWQTDFPHTFDVAANKGIARYFSDVVDNNARREIRKGNKFYDNYHSLYGDDWFKSTL